MRAPQIFLVILWLSLLPGCSESQHKPSAPMTPATQPALHPPAAELFAHEGAAVVVRNSVHGLIGRFEAGAMLLFDPADGWSTRYELTGVGRTGAVSPVGPGPVTVDADRRTLRVARGGVTEWYVNTIQGIEQGFDIAEQPAGGGALTLEGRLETSLVVRALDGDTIALERDGRPVLTYSGLVVTDATGKRLDATLVWDAPVIRIEVDDRTAVYPVRIDPTTGDCPASWCSDGDSSTVDVCNDGGDTCVNLFDDTFEGETCVYGTFCCNDGNYHADCSDPSVASGQDCPDDWCNDGDPGTADACSDYLPSTGDRTCSHAFDATLEGSACVYGANCCADGKFHEDCSDPSIPTGQDCPDGWCNDGDPGTIDACGGYVPATGDKTCTSVFDPTLADTPCTYGANCCADGKYHADCSDPSISAGQDCPDGWCNDGDPTTQDTCGDYIPSTGAKTCSSGLDLGTVGDACQYGSFCCDGLIAETCGGGADTADTTGADTTDTTGGGGDTTDTTGGDTTDTTGGDTTDTTGGDTTDTTGGDTTDTTGGDTTGGGPVSTCGDGVVEELETCDDGGVLSGDGCSSSCALEAWSLAIKVDHFGYRGGDPKVAIFSADPGATVQVRDATGAVLFTVPDDGGSITSKGSDGAPSGDDVWWVDFTTLTGEGTDRTVYSPSLVQQSAPFDVGSTVYDAVGRAALKTYYFQRCGVAHPAVHAGEWADDTACHVDDATTSATPDHTDHGDLDLTGGWHDAGDYNKYIWADLGTAMVWLLSSWEDHPDAFGDVALNIPESSNGLADVLDEAKVELDWMLKMQLPDGSVLSQTHSTGFTGQSPPSADETLRFYQDANLESGATFAASMALASRIFADAGETAYAATLETAALSTWAWLQTQTDSEHKVWAAAEIFRMDGTQTEARDYVDAYAVTTGTGWANEFFNVLSFTTHAALAYIQTPGATASVVTDMSSALDNQVDFIFGNDDLYRNGMASWAYHWGSNKPRAARGAFLSKAADLGLVGSQSAPALRQHALDFLHFFHGQNALSMVYLTNMSALGGEHSSWQFYHAWFGDSRSAFSTAQYLGKPPAITEPHYPYYAGVDNLGISDDNSAVLGPAPGFIPGGPNMLYAGTAEPPLNTEFYNLAYRDWAHNDLAAEVKPWEISENSISYQAPYVYLIGAFVSQ